MCYSINLIYDVKLESRHRWFTLHECTDPARCWFYSRCMPDFIRIILGFGSLFDSQIFTTAATTSEVELTGRCYCTTSDNVHLRSLLKSVNGFSQMLSIQNKYFPLLSTLAVILPYYLRCTWIIYVHVPCDNNYVNELRIVYYCIARGISFWNISLLSSFGFLRTWMHDIQEIHWSRIANLCVKQESW